MAIDEDKKHLHTTISADAFSILKSLAVNTSIGKVLEDAIMLAQLKESMINRELMVQIQKSTLDDYRLSHLMLNDFRMMAVGRRTFLSYIETLPSAPIKENNAIELIEWYYDNKYLINLLSLEQILKAIKALWIAGKYFNGVQIQPLDEDRPGKTRSFKLIVTHDFNDKKYGEYWSQYFTHVLSNPPIKAQVEEVAIRNQSFNITVSQSTTASASGVE